VIATDKGLRFVTLEQGFKIAENKEEVLVKECDVTSFYEESIGKYICGVYE
jgi:hypothetical protein